MQTLSGTSMSVRYDNNWVYLLGRRSGATLTAGFDETDTLFCLPSKVKVTTEFSHSLMIENSASFPTSINGEVGFTSDGVRIRSVGAIANAVLYFNVIAPREFFDITE